MNGEKADMEGNDVSDVPDAKRSKTDEPVVKGDSVVTETASPEITLYTATTMLGWDVAIALEELGIPYAVQRVEELHRHISYENEDVQSEDFLAVNA